MNVLRFVKAFKISFVIRPCRYKLVACVFLDLIAAEQAHSEIPWSDTWTVCVSAGTMCPVWYLRGAPLSHFRLQSTINTNIALIVSVSSSRSWVLNIPFGKEHQAVQVYFWPEGYSRACHVEGEDLKITPCNVNPLQD